MESIHHSAHSKAKAIEKDAAREKEAALAAAMIPPMKMGPPCSRLAGFKCTPVPTFLYMY